ncbi:MAG: hypothetical protein GY774_21570, partial [Planctomycetes bacterium]|nr:hypothetical protein [Planctomycetota bacterium]
MIANLEIDHNVPDIVSTSRVASQTGPCPVDGVIDNVNCELNVIDNSNCVFNVDNEFCGLNQDYICLENNSGHNALGNVNFDSIVVNNIICENNVDNDLCDLNQDYVCVENNLGHNALGNVNFDSIVVNNTICENNVDNDLCDLNQDYVCVENNLGHNALGMVDQVDISQLPSSSVKSNVNVSSLQYVENVDCFSKVSDTAHGAAAGTRADSAEVTAKLREKVCKRVVPRESPGPALSAVADNVTITSNHICKTPGAGVSGNGPG